MGCFDLPLYLTVQHSRAGANLWFTAYGLYALVTGQVQKHMLPLTLLALMGSVLLIIIGADIMDKVIGAELRKSIKDKVDSSRISYFLQTLLTMSIMASVVVMDTLGPWTTMRMSINASLFLVEGVNMIFMPFQVCRKASKDTTKKTD
mmetsp:Transcript_4003/g.8248  ORF Transcript_4003/g.8248 Transcript_4003/m.8248 type:complete len:148 (+) Transcript_4003:80-523(+)